MALKSELMAMGMPASLARVLGFDPPVNVTASGTTIGTATLLSGNHAIVSAGTSGVQIGDAQQQWYIQNGLGGSVVVYPPTGNNFSGLTSNTGITVPSNKALFIEPGGPTGITWAVSA